MTMRTHVPGSGQALRGMATRWTCGTCKRPQAPDAVRMREPGWEPGDYDCVACWLKSHPVPQEENQP